jgi:anti-anti-sigma regulatory factor
MRRDDDGDEETVIRLEGVLDGLAARRVEATLALASPGSRIRIDLTHVRDFHDFGVAVLGNAVTRCPASVQLSGLRQHHIRVLRYFGIRTAWFEADGAPDGA